MLKGSPWALVKCSFVRSQYLIGMIPPLIQFWWAPLSTRATMLIEKSLTTSLLIEYHFWNVTCEIVCRNWFSGISVSGTFEISKSRFEVLEELASLLSRMESLASVSKSLVLRLTISVLSRRAWALRLLTSTCSYLVVICW